MQSEILILDQTIAIFNDSFLGIICHDDHATLIAVDMLMAINNGPDAIVLDENPHGHIL